MKKEICAFDLPGWTVSLPHWNSDDSVGAPGASSRFFTFKHDLSRSVRRNATRNVIHEIAVCGTKAVPLCDALCASAAFIRRRASHLLGSDHLPVLTQIAY
jgi:hypothetical protein